MPQNHQTWHVQLHSPSIPKTIHFVVSCNKSGQAVNHIKGLAREVDRSPVDFHVAIGDKATIKGKPFTRVTQKLLAWGNLDATKEGVAKAVQNENYQELRALVPQAATLINEGKLDNLPALFEIIKGGGRLALTNHTESSLLQDLHDMSQKHDWTPGTGVCDVCGSDEGTVDCNCGASRCRKCLHHHVWEWVNDDTRCKICDKPAFKQCSCKEAWCRDCCVFKGIPVVVQHMQENKLENEINEPFCVNVSEYTKMYNEEKLEYMRLEIGDDEDLLTFASKYLELFKEKIKGVNNQKQYCLQLYREYAKVHELQVKGPYNTLAEARKMSYSCVSHVPPHLQGEFERLWDALAQDCCLECGTAVPKDVDYCSKACAHASMILACGRVDPNGEANEEGIHLCKGNLELIGKVYACQKCGHNKDYKDTPSPSSSSCPFDAIIARHKENDVAVRNMWVIKKRSAEHVPEWTKRRRA